MTLIIIRFFVIGGVLNIVYGVCGAVIIKKTYRAGTWLHVRPASGLQRYAFCMINSKSAIYFVESAPAAYIIIYSIVSCSEVDVVFGKRR